MNKPNPISNEIVVIAKAGIAHCVSLVVEGRNINGITKKESVYDYNKEP